MAKIRAAHPQHTVMIATVPKFLAASNTKEIPGAFHIILFPRDSSAQQMSCLVAGLNDKDSINIRTTRELTAVHPQNMTEPFTIFHLSDIVQDGKILSLPELIKESELTFLSHAERKKLKEKRDAAITNTAEQQAA